MGKVNILHLSDMHFGVEVNDSCPVNRKQDHENALVKLKNKLKTIPDQYPNWKPDVIAISGDIGWLASDTDYQVAAGFLKDILDYFDLSAEDIILCPGNHDLVRANNINLFNIEKREHAITVLALDRLQYRCEPFEAFGKFAQNMHIPPLINSAQGHEALPYLYGMRDHKGLRFMVFNTAWNCRGDEDMRHLWIGESLVKDVETLSARVPPKPLTVTLLHHPFAHLNDSEQRIYEDYPVVQQIILNMSDVILTGHVHGKIGRSDCLNGQTRVFTSSAAYDKNSYEKG